jgi:hypothetical protein
LPSCKEAESFAYSRETDINDSAWCEGCHQIITQEWYNLLFNNLFFWYLLVGIITIVGFRFFLLAIAQFVLL